jgi:hypothetical protein
MLDPDVGIVRRPRFVLGAPQDFTRSPAELLRRLDHQYAISPYQTV